MHVTHTCLRTCKLTHGQRAPSVVELLAVEVLQLLWQPEIAGRGEGNLGNQGNQAAAAAVAWRSLSGVHVDTSRLYRCTQVNLIGVSLSQKNRMCGKPLENIMTFIVMNFVTMCLAILDTRHWQPTVKWLSDFEYDSTLCIKFTTARVIIYRAPNMTETLFT